MTQITSRNDFIHIAPQNESFQNSTIIYNGYKLLFNCNENILKNIINCHYINDAKVDSINQNATITVLVEKNLLSGSCYDLDVQDSFIPKTHPVYNPENQNKLFAIHKNKILKINYYPYHYIATCHRTALEYECICGNLKTAEYVSKTLVKQALIDLYCMKDYYPIHASAVCDNSKNTYLFLAGSHSGKTTIFLNLILAGFYPMNDDILMLRQNENQITVHSIPILPNIRPESFTFIPALKDIKEETFQLKTYLSDNYIENGNLKALFLPRLGCKSTNIYRVESADYRKAIIKSFSDHHQIQPDEQFLRMYKQILDKPLFIMELSTNMSSFADKFKKTIADI